VFPGRDGKRLPRDGGVAGEGPERAPDGGGAALGACPVARAVRAERDGVRGRDGVCAPATLRTDRGLTRRCGGV